MRVLEIRERRIAISRYGDPTIASGGLDTSVVAILTDAVVDGLPVIGYGFSSIGRFAQSGLIRERIAPRILAAPPQALCTADGSNLDPFAAWSVMMNGEKPGGHGERCVAVGTLDMALWDAAAKVARLPLHRYLRKALRMPTLQDESVAVYAGGGYPFPTGDLKRLGDEVHQVLALGFTHAKMKIGTAPLKVDLARIATAADVLGSPMRLAVDAMNVYDAVQSLAAADALAPLSLWWFEDVCDPHDFETQAAVVQRYAGPIATGEALFSVAEAVLVDRFGGLRRERDVLLFDPVHCYGMPGYLQIVRALERFGWPRAAFWPHGGHLFSVHVAIALQLGGSEVNPFSFAPFGGLANGMRVVQGRTTPLDVPGVGFEWKSGTAAVFADLQRDSHALIRP